MINGKAGAQNWNSTLVPVKHLASSWIVSRLASRRKRGEGVLRERSGAGCEKGRGDDNTDRHETLAAFRVRPFFTGYYTTLSESMQYSAKK
jgi:hypothetical protein